MNCTERTLAYRYAQAFFNVSGDLLTDDDYWHIQNAKNYIQYIPGVLFFISLVGIDEDVRLEMIQILLRRLQLPASFERLIVLLMEHKRVSLLADVFQAILNLYQERNHKLVFTVTTPQPLTDEDRKTFIEEFLSSVSGMSILAHYEEDKNLVAGLRALNNNYLWEYSIESRLWAIKNSLV